MASQAPASREGCPPWRGARRWTGKPSNGPRQQSRALQNLQQTESWAPEVPATAPSLAYEFLPQNSSAAQWSVCTAVIHGHIHDFGLRSSERNRSLTLLHGAYLRRSVQTRRSQRWPRFSHRIGRPWKVDLIIQFTDESRAVRFERYLQSGSGVAFAKAPLEVISLAADAVHNGWTNRRIDSIISSPARRS